MTEQQALAIALAAEAAGNQAAMAMRCDSGDFAVKVYYRTETKPEFVEITFRSSARPVAPETEPDDHPLVIGEDLFFVTPPTIEEIDE